MGAEVDFEVEFIKHDSWLLAKAEGRISNAEELLTKARKLVAKALEYNTSRVLIDNRQLDVVLDFHDSTTIANTLADDDIQFLGRRFACLCNDMSLSTYEAFETAYRNRSINFRLFKDEESAMKWLFS